MIGNLFTYGNKQENSTVFSLSCASNFLKLDEELFFETICKLPDKIPPQYKLENSQIQKICFNYKSDKKLIGFILERIYLN